MLKIGHAVTVPVSLRGPNPEAQPEIIEVPEELETVPGVPQDPDTVNFYSRNYPLEAFSVEHSAWVIWNTKKSFHRGDAARVYGSG